MDTATSDIRAVAFTPSREGDSPVLPDLLDQIPEDEQVGTVTADGAYDTRRCHAAIIERDAVPIIPIREARPAVEEGLPGDARPKRNPASDTPLWPGVLEAMDRLPRPQPDRGQDALPQSLRPSVSPPETPTARPPRPTSASPS